MDGFVPHIAIIIRVSQGVICEGTTFGAQTMQVYARNIGAGFAQKLSIETKNTRSQEIMLPMAVPTALGVRDEAILLIRRHPNATVMGLTITYEDAFGRKFESSIADDVRIGSQYKWKPLDGAHAPL